MSHAKSLRVIGQFLDIASVPSFELEKERHAQDYLLRSDSLTKTREWILQRAHNENDSFEESGRPVADDGLLRFTPIDISSAQTQGSKNLSQLLRSLGDHLDRIKASAFHVTWTPGFVSVDYQEADGLSDSRQFSPDRLRQLDLHTRFRRSSGTGQTTSGRQPIR